MKKNKIIGILVASLGVAISFTSAIALYTKTVSNVGFGIGSATYTPSDGAVSYKINNSSNPTVQPSYLKKDGTNGGASIDNVYRHIKYEYALGASYAEGLTAQDYLLGNLSVSLTNINSLVQGKVKVSMYFEGYTADTLGAQYFGSNLTTGTGGGETSITDLMLSAASLSVNARDIAVSASGEQKLIVYFMLEDTVDVLTMNEANNLWNLSVTWGPKSNDYGAAYVVSTQTLWQKDDEFIMAPNINKASSQGFEWIATVKGSDTLTAAKCMHDNGTWSGGADASLVNGTTYKVYWNGANESAATFDAQ